MSILLMLSINTLHVAIYSLILQLLILCILLLNIRMDIDLNEFFGDELCIQYNGDEVDEVNLYRFYEDLHRENDVISDDVGIREFDWDLNTILDVSQPETDNFQGEKSNVNGNARVEVDVVGIRDFDLNLNMESVNNELDEEVEVQGERFVEEVEAVVEDELDDMEDEDHELLPPAVGDVFDSIDEARQYYELYAKKIGFAVVKRSIHKKRGTAFVNHVTFACGKCKEPIRLEDGPVPQRNKGYIGTGCKACVKLGDSDLSGNWVVKKVILGHNHDLVPETAFLIAGFRYIPNQYQRLLEFNEDQGLVVSVNINLVIKTAGGYMRCPFTRRDARNHIDKYKRLKLQSIGGNDAQLLFDYFGVKEKIDRDFFYRYEYTTDGRLWSVFWADGRSRASYKYFHDVIVMDATYLTNR